ncbi:flagellar basal body-associated FliL family protein [Paenibacillus chibensis]|uniref:flagellar basal body-associated FliL family protein n=1 Tax=Paenibacillus chibensis TaxID=59846 RepID=UPI000FDAC47A|nr:flagellar basal body-associated FliL family protein [Paenibacillus chibensis]MEC0373028.1 flagellar basal body-associated FliL family protein [Paenibacillus chibensis]
MKKMLPWLITILLAITLIVVAVVLLAPSMFGKTINTNTAAQAIEVKKLSADELVEMTSEITDIKTNLADQDYIVLMNFAFQLSDKKSKAEFDKIKEFKIKPIIIKTLADTKPDELRGSGGKDQLSAKLINLINKTLTEGKLTQIEITNYILTPL